MWRGLRIRPGQVRHLCGVGVLQKCGGLVDAHHNGSAGRSSIDEQYDKVGPGTAQGLDHLVHIARPWLGLAVAGRLKPWLVLPISAANGVGVERLTEEIYGTLRFMRVYLKPQGKEADLIEPLIVRDGASVGMVCDSIHRDFRRKFRYANVWGPSAVFPGQKVGLDHALRDGDVLMIVVRRQ